MIIYSGALYFLKQDNIKQGVADQFALGLVDRYGILVFTALLLLTAFTFFFTVIGASHFTIALIILLIVTILNFVIPCINTQVVLNKAK